MAWQVLSNITPEYGLSFLEKMRFRNLSYVDNENMSISLGGFTEGVRVVDMAKGFSTLANNGSYSDRTCIREIKRAGDGTVYKNTNEKTQVYNEDAAWMMTNVLQGVFNEPYGTGRSLKLDGGHIAAGKTGTTNSSKDVWFCGYTKYYTTVVWAGFDKPRAMPGASGASIPGAIWKNYMNNIHNKLKPEKFTMPSTICLARYDSNGNIIAGTAKPAKDGRTPGMDYFSQSILEEMAANKEQLKDKEYQKKVLKKLEAFEKLKITCMADYYTLEEQYKQLRDMISAIEDDDVRNRYAVRAANKYDSLADEDVKWSEVVEAYEKQISEENQRIAEQNKAASERARKEQDKKNKIALATTRINRLHGLNYKPSDYEYRISQAQIALDACAGYSEYRYLKSLFEKYKSEIMSLPTKEQYEADNKSKNNPQSSGVPSVVN